MGYRNQAQELAAQDAARAESFKRETIQEVYNRHQDFVRCQANEKAIIEAIVRWTGNPDILPTAELFEIALEADPESLKEFARQPLEHAKEQLRKEIISLLQAHSRRDEFMLKAEENRLKHFSIEALRIRLAELKTKINMASTPVSMLKAFVAEAHRDTRPYSGYPTLPRSVWNGTSHVPLNATTIKAMDAWEIKKYSRLYSVQQLNDRIKEG